MASRRDTLTLERGRDAWCAFAAAAIALAAYLVTMPPSFGMWDTAELQTVAAILGIAHPPGSPAFTLLGYAVVHLFPFGEAATRVNVMCAIAAAASVAFAYAMSRRLGAERVPSFVCALAFGLTLVTWRDATRAEVQDLALCARVAALFFGVRWFQNGKLRDLAAAWIAVGCACATHGLSLFVIPSIVLLTVARRGWWRGAPTFAAIAGGFVLGISPYIYLPLRSAWIDAHHLDPTAALGLPPGLPFWNYDDPSTWRNFVHFVTGADFHVRGGFAGYVALARYPDFAVGLSRQIAAAYGYVGTMLALGGAIAFALSRRLDRIAVILAALLPLPYIVAYPDVQDRERYYAIALWCAAVAMPFAFDRVATLFALRPASLARYALAFAVALSFATVGPERLQLWEQRENRTGLEYVKAVLAFTPDDAIVMADWSYATPLAYAGYVDGAIGRRIVVASSARQYLRYAARWVRTRPVYFVGFDDDLVLPGWHVKRVHSGVYYAYRLSK